MTEYSQLFELDPQVKERARYNPRGRNFYTPKDTKVFESKVGELWAGPKFEGDIELDVELYEDFFIVKIREVDWPRTPGLDGDLDNYVKAISDGLNKKAYKDDDQITSLQAWFQRSPF